jgi:hypothetical protein
MSHDAHSEDADAGSNKRPDIRLLIKLIALFLGVVVITIGLYVAVDHYIPNAPAFLAFIIFLAFTVPTAFILRLGLNEAVDANAASSNKFIKLIGATPTLVIIACLLALLLTVADLRNSIIPGRDTPRYLIANLKVTCWSGTELNTEPAPYLLTLITAGESSYIADIRNELTLLRNDPTPKYNFTFVGQNPQDDFYSVLKTPSASANGELNQIQPELSDESKWLAFTVPANDPHTVTLFPIPTIVGRTHNARLFIVIRQPRAGRVAATGDPIGGMIPPAGGAQPRYIVRQLAELGLSPDQPERNRQFAQFDMRVYANRTCWIPAPADQ